MKFNVIMILLDGARVDKAVNAPHIGKFFQKSIFFPNAITYAPYTLAALHAVFSGIYGKTNGVDNYFGSHGFKSKMCKTLTQYLKDAGYFTRGDTFSDIFIPKQGFDNLTIHDESSDDLIERHKEILRELNKVGENFFLFLHYSKIHANSVRDVAKKYDDLDKDFFKDISANSKRYETYLEAADLYFSQIFGECKRLGIVDNTLIILMADHGVSVGEKFGEKMYGVYCYDYTLKAFVSFYCPSLFKQPNLIKNQVRSIDIMPTILDFLEIEEELGYLKIEGETLLPLLKNGEEDKERIGYAETGGLGGPNPSPKIPNVKCIRTNKWKLIYNSTTKLKELYNLEQDPKEEKNLIDENLEMGAKLWGLLVSEMGKEEVNK